MSNKFDLERFKAGEPAYDEYGWEKIYLATSPNGDVVYWNVDLKMPGIFQIFQRETWTMKPKEEWVLLHKMLNRTSSSVYPSKEAALSDLDATDMEIFEAVKIIRE